LRSIIMPRILFDRLKIHLLGRLEVEREAFMLGGWDSTNGLQILVRDLIPIHSNDLDSEGDNGLELKDEKKVQLIRQCKQEGACLLEAHTHPFSDRSVGFSSYDLQNLKEFVKYVRIRLPNTPYCAMVWGKNSMRALIWDGKTAKGNQVDELVVRGERPQRIRFTASEKNAKSTSGKSLEIYDRQVRAFGISTQRTISSQKVAIVGAGGTGSHILQQLSYLGVQNIVLIDDDKVDSTSLNRLVGAFPSDVGKWKTKVLARAAGIVNPNMTINTKPLKLRSRDALNLLKDVDIIFGCVDNDGARLVLSELSAAYMVPYFDVASEITMDDGKITEAGGSVSVYLPLETNCLWCSRKIDPNEASFDLATEAEKGERLKRGYFNVPEPAPAVVSLNGVVASLAVNEFMALVSGQRLPRSVRYDFLTSKVVPQKWSVDPACAICKSNLGTGERANIDRYALEVKGRR
jgi:molybdopterin/thiamine biosynthesis adenylyltransferase